MTEVRTSGVYTLLSGSWWALVSENDSRVAPGALLPTPGVLTLSVCGGAESIQEALSMVAKVKPDIVVVDMVLGEENGLRLIPELQALGHVLARHDALRLRMAGDGPEGTLTYDPSAPAPS